MQRVDAEIVEAYRSFASTIRVGLEAPGRGDLRALGRTTLQAYATALERSVRQPDVAAWAAFVRSAAALHEAFDREPERYVDPAWRHAAATLTEIVRENADLLPSPCLCGERA